LAAGFLTGGGGGGV
jgi:hypothetical protein